MASACAGWAAAEPAALRCSDVGAAGRVGARRARSRVTSKAPLLYNRGMSLSGTLFRFILPKAAPEPEQLSIVHAGDTLPVTFVRSARARRVSLRVDSAGRRIVLTAPLRMSRAMAVGFAEAQAGWIAARLKRLPASPAVPRRRRGAAVRRGASHPPPPRHARHGVARSAGDPCRRPARASAAPPARMADGGAATAAGAAGPRQGRAGRSGR